MHLGTQLSSISQLSASLGVGESGPWTCNHLPRAAGRCPGARKRSKASIQSLLCLLSPSPELPDPIAGRGEPSTAMVNVSLSPGISGLSFGKLLIK